MSEVVCKWAIVSPKRFGPSFLPLSIAYCKVEIFSKDNRETDLLSLNSTTCHNKNTNNVE